MPSFTTLVVYSTIGYIALTLALFTLSLLGVKFAGLIARGLGAYVSLVTASTYGIFASIALNLVGQGGSGQYAAGRVFKWMMYLTCGVIFTVEDPNGYLDKVRPAVIIGNHQTELDVLMLGTIFPKNCSVTAKASLKRWPALGQFMSLSHAVFIDRKNSKDARQAMAGAAKQIKANKQSVYMFPEGTRSYSKEPELLPFKKGAFHLAIQAQAPILPVVAANYSHILYPKKLHFTSGQIPCKVLDPIPTEGLTSADVDELARKTRDLMLAELVSLTARARGQPVPVPAVVEQEAATKATGADVKPVI